MGGYNSRAKKQCRGTQGSKGRKRSRLSTNIFVLKLEDK
jgi:hypothetical protein